MQFPAHFPIASAQSNPLTTLPLLLASQHRQQLQQLPNQSQRQSQQLLIIHNNNTTSNHSYNITTPLYTNYTHSDHSIRAHKFSLPNTFRSSIPSSTLTQTATYKFSFHSLYSDHRIRATKNFQIHPLSHLHTLQSSANDCKIPISHTFVTNSQQRGC